MADYNAHTYFGMQVLERLPPTLRRRCLEDFSVFQMGLYGPDPLIFSFKTKKISDQLHKNWRADTLPALEHALSSGDSSIRSFAAGYMLHQMLDDVVHPKIYQWMEDGSSHFRLEVALDILILREKRCLNPPKLMTDGKLRTARAGSLLLRPANQRQYLSGLWRMALLTEYFRHGGMRDDRKVNVQEMAQARELRARLEDSTRSAAEELTRRMDLALASQGGIPPRPKKWDLSQNQEGPRLFLPKKKLL